jgi:large subunit ribosomal protein L17
MRHLKSGRKLKRTSSHRKALLRTLATALFEHKKIKTTEAKAKELRPYAEKLITRAKTAIFRENNGQLPEGHKVDVHNRRIVGRFIANKAVLEELFITIAPAVEDRPGGYTRIVKTGIRRGDAGREAIIELVDFSAPLDGNVNLKARRKRTRKPGEAPAKPATGKEIAEESPVEVSAPTPVVDRTIETFEAPVAEAIEAEVVAEETITAEAPVTEAPIENVEIKDEAVEGETEKKAE